MLDSEANAKRGSIYPRLVFYDFAALVGGGVNLKVHKAALQENLPVGCLSMKHSSSPYMSANAHN